MKDKNIEFVIVGGKLKVHSRVLAKEMIKRESLLKSFVLASKSASGKPPKVIKDESEWITIDFTGAEMPLPSGLEEAFTPLKIQYKGNIEGSVTCLLKYNMMQGVSLTTIRFDGE